MLKNWAALVCLHTSTQEKLTEWLRSTEHPGMLTRACDLGNWSMLDLEISEYYRGCTCLVHPDQFYTKPREAVQRASGKRQWQVANAETGSTGGDPTRLQETLTTQGGTGSIPHAKPPTDAVPGVGNQPTVQTQDADRYGTRGVKAPPQGPPRSLDL